MLGNRVRMLAMRCAKWASSLGTAWRRVLPNVPEAVIALLATTAIGAIWAVCSPDFGVRGILDRLAALLAETADRHRRLSLRWQGVRPSARDGRGHRRLDGSAPRHPAAVLASGVAGDAGRGDVAWSEIFERAPIRAEDFKFEEVPFDHPLWILFSSGTTGLPKPIVQGHGGILLELQKNGAFHFDLHAGDRLLFFTTSGWMLWNFVASTPLLRAVPVLYDGHPAYPQPDLLWKLAQDAQVALFGASPAYVEQQSKAGIVPASRYELSAMRSIVLAGSPATPECMQWFYRNVKRDLWVANGSGGTDCCTGFVGGVPTLPVRAGEIQAPSLGVSVKAFDERGESVIDTIAELVITEPMPSMPLRFWNDESGRRYRETYFEQFPGVWCHGDFFRIDAQGTQPGPGATRMPR